MSARLVAGLAFACSTLAIAVPDSASAGTAIAQMRVSVTVVAPPRRDAAPNAVAETAPADADAPVAVVTDAAAGTQLIIY